MTPWNLSTSSNKHCHRGRSAAAPPPHNFLKNYLKKKYCFNKQLFRIVWIQTHFQHLITRDLLILTTLISCFLSCYGHGDHPVVLMWRHRSVVWHKYALLWRNNKRFHTLKSHLHRWFWQLVNNNRVTVSHIIPLMSHQ